MKSLNTYNYEEQLKMLPFSCDYNVTISENDKVIKIEEDGSLIAELSLGISNNILQLIGKEGVSFAEVELPVSMQKITGQRYNPDTKKIELAILQTNGNEVTFELDVAELVNIYTAGDGIEINAENIISIKLNDESGTLTLSEQGLGINLGEVNENIDGIQQNITDLQSSTEQLKQDTTILEGKTEKLNNDLATVNSNLVTAIDTINQNVFNGFKVINESISGLHVSLDNEKNERVEEDEKLKALIDTQNENTELLSSKLETEIDERKKSDAEINGRIDSLSTKHDSDVSNLNKADETLSSGLSTLNQNVVDITNNINKNVAEGFEAINNNMANGFNTINTNVYNVKKASEDRDKVLDEKITAERNERVEEDARIEKLIESNNSTIGGLSEKLDKEITDRKDECSKIANNLSQEITNRQNADVQLKDEVVSGYTSLVESIKMERDPKNNLHYILYRGDTIIGEINIPSDKVLESVRYDEELRDLVFTWNDENKTSINVPLDSLVDIYKNGNGLLLNSNTNTFSVNLSDSNMLNFGANGQINFVGKFIKDENKPWVYNIFDQKNVKYASIDFSGDFETVDTNISKKYATIDYVNSEDAKVKSSVVGNALDNSNADTINGLRNKIDEVSKGLVDKMGNQDKEVFNNSKAYADNLVDTKTKELIDKIDAEKNTLQGNINKLEEKHNTEITSVRNDISNNSTNIDLNKSKIEKLDNNFHEVLANISESEYKVKGIEAIWNKIGDLEQTIANKYNECLYEAKKYIDKEVLKLRNEIIENSKNDRLYADAEIAKAKEEFNKNVNENFVSKVYADSTYHKVSDFNTTIANYYTKAESDGKFQLKGNYITEIPTEYITETELAEKNFVTETSLSGKNYITKTVFDAQNAAINNELSNRYTKAEVDDLVNGINTSVSGNFVTQLSFNEYKTHVSNNYSTTEVCDGKYASKNELSLVNEKINLHKDAINSTTTKLNDVTSRLTTLENVSKTHATKDEIKDIGDLRRTVDSMSIKMETFQTQLGGKASNEIVSSINNRLANAETKISNHSISISSIQTNVNNNTAKLNAANNSIATLDAKVANLVKEQETANGRIDALNRNLTETNNSVTENATNINSHQTAINDLRQQDKAINDLITKINGDLTSKATSQALNELSKRVDDLHGKVSANMFTAGKGIAFTDENGKKKISVNLNNSDKILGISANDELVIKDSAIFDFKQNI